MTPAIAATFNPRASLIPGAPSPFSLAAAPRLVSSWRPLRRCSGRTRTLVVVASSLPPFGESQPFRKSPKQSFKKSVILNLVQEIEPLDVSVIQKDVQANTVDAMKRTISGMLGLLPSDQFGVQVGAFWGPLFKLLISSMKTGYTLRNAEFRLCLERNLDIHEHEEVPKEGISEHVASGSVEASNVVSPAIPTFREASNILHDHAKNDDEASCDSNSIKGLEELAPNVREYILYLQSRLDSAEEELQEIKGKSSALQTQQLAGEETNDLLDYLRSLQPEKVAELSQLTCPGLDGIIHSTVHGLLASLSPRVHAKPPRRSENPTGGSSGAGEDDRAELVENSSIQSQPLISIPRDYLARLLFWCMLLGHYIRGLEHRLDLMELLALAGDE